MAKAEELFEKHNIFKNLKPGDRIKPLNSVILDKKARQAQQQLTTGAAWGDMERQELTEEVKADLRAIQLRDKIYTKRFYKANEHKKLPEFFQIGTIVDDPRIHGNHLDRRKVTKAGAGSIARQFLEDDEAAGFSKRKYEGANERLRRMGEKKKALKTKLKLNKASKGIKKGGGAMASGGSSRRSAGGRK